MSPRPRRMIWPADQAALLEALGECRAVSCAIAAHAPINGELYKALGRLMEAIDDVAANLTGDRAQLRGRGHATPAARKTE